MRPIWYLATFIWPMWLSHIFELCEHSCKVVFIRGVFIRELNFISTVVCLLVGVFLQECCVAWNLRFSDFEGFVSNSGDIMKTKIVLRCFARDAFFWSNWVEICLGGSNRGGVEISCINYMYDVGKFAVWAISMFVKRWTSWLEKLLTMIWKGRPGDTSITLRAANEHWRLDRNILCLIVRRPIEFFIDKNVMLCGWFKSVGTPRELLRFLLRSGRLLWLLLLPWCLNWPRWHPFIGVWSVPLKRVRSSKIQHSF